VIKGIDDNYVDIENIHAIDSRMRRQYWLVEGSTQYSCAFQNVPLVKGNTSMS